uniref:Uncharacterized protein n=1 Tax=Moniliophthora roreri TaxID=221103 RepID=A0A0W0FPJ3_MONRR
MKSRAITQASATFRKEEKAQDYVKGARECVGRPVKKHTVVKKYKLRLEHNSPDWEYSSPGTQSFPELCTNAAQTSTTLQLYEPEGQFQDSEDLHEDGEEDDYEESMHLWEEALVIRMQNSTETRKEKSIHAPLTKSEKKAVKAMVSLTPTQKQYLDQYYNLYVIYRNHTTDRGVSYWNYLHHFIWLWLWHWTPPHWLVWHWNMKSYWKCVLQEVIIWYYNWKSGTIFGLRKLEQARNASTPPSSLAGHQPAAVLSMPTLGCEILETLTKPGRKTFIPLFNN